VCFSTTPITWHCWRSLPAFGLLLVSVLLSATAQADGGDYGPNESIYWAKSGFASNGFPDNQDGNAAYYLDRCEIASTTEGKKYAYCYKDVYQSNPGSPSPFWHVNIIGVKAQENCGTGVVPGGAIVQGDFESNGAGIYAIGGCEYSCGINFTLLDGQTSAYDATQCKGQGAPATAPDGFVRPNDGSECTVFDNLDRCLDMDQQEGGACPTGTTYGQVNGENVCVPSGESTDGLDEGSEGPEGEGGDSPADGSGDGTGDGDGAGDGTGDGDGSGDGGTCVPSETNDCEGEGDGNGDGSDGECVPTEDQPCDEGDGSYSSNGCEAPPECEGDAIQCGIVQETWEDRCLIHEASEQADGFFSQQTNGIGNLNDEGLELVDSLDMDLSEEMTDFTAVSDPAPASCPEPVQLNLSLGAYEVEFTAFCDLAEQVRPLTLFIFSFLGALSIARAVMGVI
jgi:hypothetical protein